MQTQGTTYCTAAEWYCWYGMGCPMEIAQNAPGDLRSQMCYLSLVIQSSLTKNLQRDLTQKSEWLLMWSMGPNSTACSLAAWVGPQRVGASSKMMKQAVSTCRRWGHNKDLHSDLTKNPHPPKRHSRGGQYPHPNTSGTSEDRGLQDLNRHMIG